MEPRRILRVQFDEIPSLKDLDEPIQTIAGWFQNRILGSTFNEAAHAGTPAYLFFDEAQNLSDWAPQIKTLVDHHTVHVVVTGRVLSYMRFLEGSLLVRSSGRSSSA